MFDRLATRAACAVGSPLAFFGYVAAIAAWLALGPILGWSDGWQLVVNTGTTIITMGLVILLQYTQNKGDQAEQLKLDALIDDSGADNALVAVEQMTGDELEDLHQRVVAAMQHTAENGVNP